LQGYSASGREDLKWNALGSEILQVFLQNILGLGVKKREEKNSLIMLKRQSMGKK